VIRDAAAALVCCLLGALMAPSPASADSIRNREWILYASNVATAHGYSQGNGVTVAVIDTGVDAGHIDLRGNILPGTDFTSGSPHGTGTNDADGHGTGMAGLVVGHGHGTNDRDGILGIAPQAKVLPIRLISHPFSNGGTAGLAVAWAVAHGATVVCMAFGSNTSDSRTADALLAAEQANVVLVAAAGNVTQGSRMVEYPAAYPGVVAVAGTDEHGNHSKVSVIGNLVTLAAPSDDIPTTYNNGGYAIGSGTSSSTAIVAGAAALVRSRFPNLTAGEVVNRLTATAIDKGPPGHDDEYGYGLINLVGALTAQVPPAGSQTPAASSAATAPAPTHIPSTAAPSAIASPSHSKATTGIAIVGIAFVVMAVIGAWTLIRRRRPG
jgi:type VII secretion-associated serine protease mycosin